MVKELFNEIMTKKGNVQDVDMNKIFQNVKLKKYCCQNSADSKHSDGIGA